jgi:hypothetical protein
MVISSATVAKPDPPEKRMASVLIVRRQNSMMTCVLTGHSLWLQRYESGKRLPAPPGIITLMRPNGSACLMKS